MHRHGWPATNQRANCTRDVNDGGCWPRYACVAKGWECEPQPSTLTLTIFFPARSVNSRRVSPTRPAGSARFGPISLHTASACAGRRPLMSPVWCAPAVGRASLAPWDWCRWLKRLLKELRRQIPDGLKPARDVKNKGLTARLKSCPDTKLLAREFFSTL